MKRTIIVQQLLWKYILFLRKYKVTRVQPYQFQWKVWKKLDWSSSTFCTHFSNMCLKTTWRLVQGWLSQVFQRTLHIWYFCAQTSRVVFEEWKTVFRKRKIFLFYLQQSFMRKKAHFRNWLKVMASVTNSFLWRLEAVLLFSFSFSTLLSCGNKIARTLSDDD